MIYQDPDVAHSVGEDPQTAPIPELHKAMFRLAKRFVQSSWTADREDIEALRALGATERDISEWLQIASIQTWFTNSADAGGIPLEGDAVTGPVLERSRSIYRAGICGAGSLADRTSTPVAASRDRSTDDWWLQPDRASTGYVEAAAWAQARYGFVPGLIDTLSTCPDFYPRHQLALELLERPQSGSLNRPLHALVRATVVALDRCHYFQPTVTEMLQRSSIKPIDLELLREAPDSHFDDRETLLVLEFVQKMAKNAFKISEADAEAFRVAGLGDEVYVDVFNTVAIQQSLNRLANFCGVPADHQPLLAQEKVNA